MKPTPPPPPPPPPQPYDAEIEYIESDGQQFIDTGILVSEYPLEVEFKALVISATRSENDFFGSMYGPEGERACVVCGHYNGKFHVWTGSRWQPQQLDFGQWYDIILILPNKQEANMSINGNDYHKEIVSNITASRSTICIFCDGQQHKSFLIGRLASFKMTINNSLVLDMIPVRIGSVGMMYDRKSGEFFGNNGSGEFRCGPDIG